MGIFAERCVHCGCRTRESFDGRPSCERCSETLRLKLAAAQERPLACPVDGTQMTKVVAHTLVIDRCPACHGAWLDGGELERLRDDVARDSMIAIARGALGAS